MTGISVEELMARWRCRPICNCPGRYVIADCPRHMPPGEVVGGRVPVLSYEVATARDRVFVAAFDQGGLISYQRGDGTFLHTLNEASGFRRKLRLLGIEAGG